MSESSESDSETLLLPWGESAYGGTDPAYGVTARLTAKRPSSTSLIKVSTSMQAGGNLQQLDTSLVSTVIKD